MLLGVRYSEGVTALFLLRLADLFWALLGGGGGTYGILTSMTYRTYPSLPVAAAVIVIKTVSANTTQALFTELLRITPHLSDAGWAGYGRVTSNHISFLATAPNVSAMIANESVSHFSTAGPIQRGACPYVANVVMYIL